MKKEPLWRAVLNWGCVIYFLGLPALGIILALAHIPFDKPELARFLGQFHLAISALVAAMAGLNSFDRHKANGNQGQGNQVK
jgi:hypothetical protein